MHEFPVSDPSTKLKIKRLIAIEFLKTKEWNPEVLKNLNTDTLVQRAQDAGLMVLCPDVDHKPFWGKLKQDCIEYLGRNGWKPDVLQGWTINNLLVIAANNGFANSYAPNGIILPYQEPKKEETYWGIPESVLRKDAEGFMVNTGIEHKIIQQWTMPVLMQRAYACGYQIERRGLRPQDMTNDNIIVTKPIAIVQAPKAAVVTVKTKPKVSKNIKVVIHGHTCFIRGDTEKLYHLSNPYGAEAFTQMRKGDLPLLLNDNPEAPDEACLLKQPPDLKYKLPTPYLIEWADKLLKFNHEMLVVYGVDRKNPKKFMAVAPMQEVSTGSVDVDDFSKAFALLSKLGYQKIGTIHTHPGNMTNFSSTDENDLFNDVGGIHIIIDRGGNHAYYFSTQGHTWKLETFDGWKPSAIAKDSVVWKQNTVVTEDNKTSLKDIVKIKTYVKTTSVTNWQTNRYDPDRDYEDYWGRGAADSTLSLPFSRKALKKDRNKTNHQNTQLGLHNLPSLIALTSKLWESDATDPLVDIIDEQVAIIDAVLATVVTEITKRCKSDIVMDGKIQLTLTQIIPHLSRIESALTGEDFVSIATRLLTLIQEHQKRSK